MTIEDLYRPLGLDRDDTAGRRLPVVGRPALLAGLAVAVLAAGSLATSLTQPAFRHRDVFAERAPIAPKAAENPPSATLAAVTAAPLRPLGRTSAPEAVSDPDLPTITYPPGATGGYGRELSMRDPVSLRQPRQEVADPDETLLEPSDFGPLPARAADGRRPFDVYSVEPATGAGTRVAIVVGGLGISQTGTMQAVERLPASVTLAFAPGGNSLERWMRQARQNGHELLVQVPMEPFGYPNVSPGAHTLTAEDAGSGHFDELHWALGRLTNYVGVANYMGARLTGSEPAMRGLAAELARRGLMYLDDGTSSRSLSRDAMREAGGVQAGADVLIDAAQDPAEIAKRLDTLERTARANGQAIGVASAFDVSVAEIVRWIAEAEKRGIRIVPVSALASDPEAR